MLTSKLFSLNRRDFLRSSLLCTVSLLALDYSSPNVANAESISSVAEKYHLFVPYNIAKNGGKQELILRSGERLVINLPRQIHENQEISYINNAGEYTYFLILHTFYDDSENYNKILLSQIYDEIENHTNFIKKSSSKIQCRQILEQLKDGLIVSDLTVLELLDYIVSSSKLDNTIKERYKIASNNSRLLEIKQVINDTLSESNLTEDQKRKLRATFQYVRAQEIIPDFKDLYDLDTIVAASDLSTTLKHYYFVASSTSRALTVDAIIIKYLVETQKLSQSLKEIYLSVYKKIRSGEKNSDSEQEAFHLLDMFIKSSDLPENVKFIFENASNINKDNSQKNVTLDQAIQIMSDSLNNGQEIPSTIRTALTTIGTETATGVSFASLAGGAATNSMLAFLGGGSVASGGLGMLGGLAVITGGSALIGAAGLLSILLVAEMDTEDLQHLGIAIGSGTLFGATGVLTAWVIAGTLGVAESLSGAAAISATIAALGGLSILTGGAAFIASGATFLIWSFLQSHKTRNGKVLKELETRTYTLTEFSPSEILARFIGDNLSDDTHFGNTEGYSSPFIPLDKLSNALSTWLSVRSGEKILGLLDTSIWNDAKEGLVLTNKRIVWKKGGSPNFISYQNLKEIFMSKSSDLTKEQIHILSDLRGILGRPYKEFDNFLVAITNEYT